MTNQITIRTYKIEKEFMGKNETASNDKVITLPQTVPLENIQQAMKLLGFDEIYTIQEGEGLNNDKVLYIHPKLTEIDNRLIAEREARYETLRLKAANFNKLINPLKTWTFSNGYEIRLIRRNLVDFNAKFSNERICGSVWTEMFVDNKGTDRRFDVTGYISQDGKVLAKSFHNWFQGIPENVRNEIITKIKEINAFEKQFRRDWNL